METPSTDKLVSALQQAQAPTDLINDAKAQQFHDFLSPSALPMSNLVNRLTGANLLDLARMAMAGEFDANKEEADAWGASDEGQATLAAASE